MCVCVPTENCFRESWRRVGSENVQVTTCAYILILHCSHTRISHEQVQEACALQIAGWLPGACDENMPTRADNSTFYAREANDRSYCLYEML